MRKTGRLAAGVLTVLAAVLGAGTGEAHAGCSLAGGVATIAADSANEVVVLDADLRIEGAASACAQRSELTSIRFVADADAKTGTLKLGDLGLAGGGSDNEGEQEIEVDFHTDYTRVVVQSQATTAVSWRAGINGGNAFVAVNADGDADITTDCGNGCVEMIASPTAGSVLRSDNATGGVGDDVGARLTGRAGNDTLTGGSSADTIVPGPGTDTVTGAGGVDNINALDGEIDELNCGAGTDTGFRDRIDNVPATNNCEFDVAQVTFDSATATIAEEGGPLVVGLTLSRAIPRAASVKVLTTAGTATANTDYSQRTNAAPAIEFAANTTTAQVSIPITNDQLDESSETFTLSFAAESGEIASAGTVTVTITDDDVPQVTVEDVTLDEGGAAKSVTLRMSLASDAQQSVRLARIPSDPGGLSTSDISSFVLDRTVTFEAGAQEQTLSISALEDDIDELAESMTLRLSNPSPRVQIGSADRSVVTVSDTTETPVVAVSDAVVTEGGTAQVTLAVSRRSSRDMTINYAVQPGTAGADDATLSGGKFTFEAEEPTGAVLTIATKTDSVFDPDETLTVAISSAGPAPVTIARAAATVTITDPSAKPVLALLDPPGVAEGNDGEAPANPVLRTSSLAGGPITATIQVTGGSAALGSDLTAPPAQVTIPAGVREVPVPVSVLGDTRYEHHEDLIVEVAGANGAEVGPDPGARVLILDDEEAPAPALDVPATLRLPGAFTPAVSGVADGATLQCSLQKPGDSAAPEFGQCPEGLSFGTLDVGRFTLAVRQVDAEGRISPAARAVFDVLAALLPPVVTPPPPEFVPAALCGDISGTLLEAVRSGKRVRLLGLARPRFAGQKIRILAGKRTVAQPTVKPDGTFEATVAAPAGSLTSYTTSLGGSAVALSKDLRVLSRSRVGGVERIRVAVPKGAARSATISRCAGRPSLGTQRITPAGTFVIVLPKPRAGEPFAVYRVSVKVGRRTLTMSVAVAR